MVVAFGVFSKMLHVEYFDIDQKPPITLTGYSTRADCAHLQTQLPAASDQTCTLLLGAILEVPPAVSTMVMRLFQKTA